MIDGLAHIGAFIRLAIIGGGLNWSTQHFNL
jgi:hypothetical protein